MTMTTKNTVIMLQGVRSLMKEIRNDFPTDGTWEELKNVREVCMDISDLESEIWQMAMDYTDSLDGAEGEGRR